MRFYTGDFILCEYFEYSADKAGAESGRVGHGLFLSCNFAARVIFEQISGTQAARSAQSVYVAQCAAECVCDT